MNLKPLAANMNQVEINGYKVLFSYETPVAVINSLGQHFKTEKFWSKTTSRHINKWLNGFKAEEKPQEFFDTFLSGLNDVKLFLEVK